VSDKPLHIRTLRPVNVRKHDTLHRKRLRTLLAVDDTIAALWSTLAQSGRLDSTYVFVLSDNGYTIGQHRRVGKTAPYDMSVRIPMSAGGPGIAAGGLDERLVANIDLAPTIADAAGGAFPHPDGFSFLEPTQRDALLLEWQFVPDFEDQAFVAEGKKKHGQRRGNAGWATGSVPDYLGLRTRDELYVVYRTGERELYDYAADPYELDNLLADWLGHAPSPAAEARAAVLAERMDQLHKCAEASCRPTP
jgi:arylsulfatase A-like enzyme